MSILVAVSDDGRFRTVLDVAVQMAVGLEMDLHVAHVTTNESASADERAFRKEVREFLEETDVAVDVSIEHLERSGLRSGTAVGKQLVDFTSDVGVDHIVIGHRSKSRLAAAREGHTGFVVAQEAAVPVTIVPESVHADS